MLFLQTSFSQLNSNRSNVTGQISLSSETLPIIKLQLQLLLILNLNSIPSTANLKKLIITMKNLFMLDLLILFEIVNAGTPDIPLQGISRLFSLSEEGNRIEILEYEVNEANG